MIPALMHEQLAKEEGRTFVHAFDDLDVATGQGTYRHGDCSGTSDGRLYTGT